MQDWHAWGRRSSVGGGVIVSGFGRPPRCDHWPKSGRSHEVTYFSFRTNRAFSSACGSATVMAPVPMTLIALRFFEPQTAPKPPWPAPLPASCTRQPCAVWFSPAGPMHSTAGGCVENVSPRSFAASRHACCAVFPRACPVCSQIACWAAHVSLPHTPAASWNVTRSLAISTHVGLAALARDDDGVPAGVLEHRREAAAESRPRVPALRVLADTDAHHVAAPAGRRRDGTVERRGADADHVGRVAPVLDRLVLAEVPEERRAEAVAAAPSAVLLGGNLVRLPGRHVEVEDLACVTVHRHDRSSYFVVMPRRRHAGPRRFT